MERSKTKLARDIKKRIETTMIGALASVEKYFGEFWGMYSAEKNDEQLRVEELYEELRSEILDKGNAQIRNIQAEIQNYDVLWQKYHINMPIKQTYKGGA